MINIFKNIEERWIQLKPDGTFIRKVETEKKDYNEIKKSIHRKALSQKGKDLEWKKIFIVNISDKTTYNRQLQGKTCKNLRETS